jgi:2-dehydro-3-deoxyglucarate aldolase
MLASGLKRQLAEGGALVGSWLALGDQAVAEIMARAGFDFLVIDMEHAPISVESASALIRTIELAGGNPMVRLPDADPSLIKTLLDSGAHGIVVANVSSAEGARAAVRATRYPPEGIRGVGLHRAQGYGESFTEYFTQANSSILVVVQIESASGVAAADEIAGVDGIDAMMIGPYDLSADLGVPGDFTCTPFIEAVETVRRAARLAGVATGVHVVEPDREAVLAGLRDGHRFMVYSVDMRIISVGARAGASIPRSPL